MKLSEATWEHGNCKTKQQKIDLIDTNTRTINHLKEGDTYYFIENNGGIIQETLRSIDFNIIRLLIGNVFLSKREARLASEKLKVETILRKHSYNFNNKEWNDSDILKHYIEYWHNIEEINIDYVECCKTQGTMYFKTEEDCKNAIDEVGEQRLINYFEGFI